MIWIVPLIFLIAFELIADYLSKSWSLKGGWVLAFSALLFYIIANSFWLFALKNGSGLARGAVIFSVASAVVAIGIGVLLFHENISIKGYVGIILGIASIILLFTE